MFSPGRLTLARKRRRLTARSLAERSGLSAVTISRLEAGTNAPDDLTIAKLAKMLGFPIAFFEKDDPDEVAADAVSFRSFSRLSARERDAAISAGTLGLELGAWIERQFSLPTPALLDLSYEADPEVAALSLRQFWHLGEKPINGLLALLESKGVRLFSLSENTAAVNAFSFWRDDKPYVFLNNFKTAESSLFDAAHELGHLVMHRHGDPKGSRSAEREAHRFAAAFLMPERDLRARTPRPMSVDQVIAMKSRWRVSAMALAHRLSTLKLIGDWQYKSFCIELGRRGYRTGEPVGIDRETSTIWKKVLSALWSERVTKNDIARQLNLPLDELEGLIWNLTGPDARPTSGRREGLRVIR